MNNIKIIKLDSKVNIPTRATDGSAGFDLQAAIESPLILRQGESKLIPTGLAIHIDNTKIAAFILPRSKQGKNGLVIGNLVGLIDSDYQGQWFINAWNRNLYESVAFQPLEKIAQVVFINLADIDFEVVDSFDTVTTRADGGISKQEDTR